MSAVLEAAPAATLPETRLLRPIDLTVEPRPISWLVRSVVPVGGKLLIAGQAGSGKSYLALDLALAVVCGTNWLDFAGFEVDNNTGPVLVVDEESPSDAAVISRLERLARGREFSVKDTVLPDRLFVYRGNGFTFRRPEMREALKAEIIRYQPRLVVFDAAVRIMAGSDNESLDVAQFWNQVTEPNRLGPAVVVVHHAGWAEEGRPRGSTDWRAGSDVELDLTQSRGSRKLSFGKVRDAAIHEPFALHLDFSDAAVRLRCAPLTGAVTLTQGRLEDSIWEFVNEGAGRRRSKRDVQEKFMPDRRGKTGFYKAVRKLADRDAGRRLVEENVDYVALA